VELRALTEQGLSPGSCYIKVDNKKAVKVRTQPVPTPKVDRDELGMVLATHGKLYQRTRAEAESTIAQITLPEVPDRDDVAVGDFETALAWSDA
jgi:hypothetical protein